MHKKNQSGYILPVVALFSLVLLGLMGVNLINLKRVQAEVNFDTHQREFNERMARMSLIVGSSSLCSCNFKDFDVPLSPTGPQLAISPDSPVPRKSFGFYNLEILPTGQTLCQAEISKENTVIEVADDIQQVRLDNFSNLNQMLLDPTTNQNLYRFQAQLIILPANEPDSLRKPASEPVSVDLWMSPPQPNGSMKIVRCFEKTLGIKTANNGVDNPPTPGAPGGGGGSFDEKNTQSF